MLMKGRALLPRVGEMDEEDDYVPGRGGDVPSRSEWLLTRRRRPEGLSGEGAGPAPGLPRRRMWDFGLLSCCGLCFLFAPNFTPGMQDRSVRKWVFQPGEMCGPRGQTPGSGSEAQPETNCSNWAADFTSWRRHGRWADPVLHLCSSL